MTAAVIRTRVAVALEDDHIFRGFRVFAELAGRETFAGLTALAVIGRPIEAEDLGVIDDIACVMCVADPRIWPLKMSRVLASYGGFVLGSFGANLCLEEALIGPWSCGGAAQVLSEIASEVGPRTSDGEAVRAAVLRRVEQGERLPGFGVPLRDADERLVALRACLRRRGRDGRPAWQLMETLSDSMRSARGLEPNIAMGLAAAALDLGVRPEHVAPLMVCLLQPTFAANAREGAEQRSAFLRDMPREHVEYVGAPPRTSPRARASAK